MSNKVKVVTYLKTTSRPLLSSSSRILINTSRPTLKASPAHCPIRHDPNLPGCSKWFSSSASQNSIPRRTFFDSNTSNAPAIQLQQYSKKNATIAQVDSYNEEHIDQASSISGRQKQIFKSPHLPLPPSLPYSPNSFPLKRHLEILSLSIYSSGPDESWTIYQSLHPTLRPYIPDEAFRSLLIHQADHTQQPRAWNRVKALLRLAKKCRMSLSEIGSESLIKVFRLGARRFRDPRSSQEQKDEIYRIIRKVYSTLEEILPTKHIPHEIRRGWLGIHHAILVRLRKTSRPEQLAQINSIEELALSMVKNGGAVGLGHYIGEILTTANKSNLKGIERSLRNLVWCIAKGVDIKINHLLKTIRRLGHFHSHDGSDGLEVLRIRIVAILEDLGIEPISNTSATLYEALDIASRRGRSRVEKALDLLQSNQLGAGGLIARGISVAMSSKLEVIVKLDTAIKLFELAIQHKESDCNALISSLTVALQKAKRSAVHSEDIDKMIIRYVRTLHEAQITPALPSESIIALFRLIISTVPSSEGYILSRKIYQYARSSSPPFVWSRQNVSSWQKLFRYSLTSPNLHLHFASRLYTDLMADGVPIRRTDALMLIRAIGLKASPSRAVLLERHIKDYLWSKYGSTSPLILALVQGLTQGGVRDTQLALDLAQRLSEGKPLSSSVVEIIVGQLSKSTNPQDRIKIFHLLEQMSTNENSIKNYNTVLSYLVTSSRRISDTTTGTLNHAESLSYAIYLYKEMINRGIKPNARTISTMMRSLIDSGYLESALSIFNACVKEKILIKSSMAGRLMVNLAMHNRLTEAYNTESAWRRLMKEKYEKHQVWDKGVIGARVLIDIKNGKEVNLDEIAKKTGWEGRAGFLKFLDSLKPFTPPRNPQAQEEEEKEENPTRPGTSTVIVLLG
ncbi:uncharacterized protein I303_105251 [Kwoniella dejecticola CBS 10117]|uniref:Uncharacterized protein n=1 Tax=Kwoniella dejecticola CBS 10117 TaxID=1296121 RepID=A0A1A6A312_9TREE|nr:uncharacterized protein I303_05301 [Kwoniella dejecticola CBS 10117]OBR84443.1 hypothetical protein I303_05301 [Kwoniella dejecticola CBS 10117]